ncbi:MAG: YjbH domain-containing protein [Melioribacteraceae bacterium]
MKKIGDILSNHGFENIRIKAENSSLFISYENRLYRFEATALKNATKLIEEALQDYKEIYFIILNRNIPLSLFVYNVDERRFVDYIFDVDEYWNKVKDIEPINSSNLKFDLVVKPDFKGEFGDYSNPVQAQLNLLPEINTNIFSGLSMSVETIVPLYNEFSVLEDSVRQGIISLSQFIRLPNSVFLLGSVGYFTNNRYGVDFEGKKYYNNGNFSLGLNFGYTGFAQLMFGKVFYSEPYLVTGNINTEYRVPEYDLTLGITAGKFIYKDMSLRFDVNRQFGEIEIGFFAIYSEGGNYNGGFNFVIPLFPSKHLKPNIVRIKTSDNYRWEYRVRGLIPGQRGRSYKTGNSINSLLEKTNPSFIKNYFINYIN